MSKKPESTKSRSQSHSKSGQPRLIRLRFSEIEFDSASRYCVLQSRLRHLPKAIPALTPSALSILELAQPMIVVSTSEANRSDCYRLVAGYRTYQLLAEQRSRDTKTWAILLPLCDEREIDSHSTFDSVVTKLLQRPDGNDLAVIAATLRADKPFREKVAEFIPISTDSNLATVLGMSRSTLNRLVIEVEKDEREYVEQLAPTCKIDLEFPEDAEDPL